MKTIEIVEATSGDIEDMHRIRLAVRENVLSDPAKVKAAHYREMIDSHGKGWVAKIDGSIRGFAFIDLRDGNVWALFIEPGFEGLGLGQKLHRAMLDFCAANKLPALWLTTESGTRADSFYQKAGWRAAGHAENGEKRYEFSLTGYQA